ncbi:MAG: T9SS type A sorting domain-containing protein [Candidatus Krumholzibacteriota bacterium]
MMKSLTHGRNALKSLVFLLILLGLGPTAQAQDCMEYLPAYPQVISPYSANPWSHSVAKSGERVLLGNSESGVFVYDASDPTLPVVTDTLQCSGYKSDIVVEGNFAFVASSTEGLKIFDITPGATPFLASSMVFANGIRDVEISGSLAYLSGGKSGMFIVDISDPALPLPIGFLDTPNSSNKVSLSGSFAYIANSNKSIDVADVSDPYNPVIVHSVSLAGSPASVLVHGNHLFAGDYEYNLYTLDIADPAHPAIIGSLPLLDCAKDLTVNDGDLWVAASSAGLIQLDMAAPDDLVIKDVVEVPNNANALFISDRLGYVASTVFGLLIVDLSFQFPDFTLAWKRISSTYPEIEIAGHYAYLPSPDGILVMDVADPINPSVTCFLDRPGTFDGIQLHGQTAYARYRHDGEQGIQVIDITDPENPQLGLTVPTPDGIGELAISANLLLTQTPLQVFDLANPSDPQLVGSRNFTWGFGWAAGPGFAVSGTFGMGVEVVDLTDPANPYKSGSCYFPGHITEIVMHGDLAFVMSRIEPAGIFVVDVSDRSNPQLMRFHQVPDFPSGMTIDGNVLYVATGLEGVMAWDISDPHDMVYLGSTFVGGTQGQVAVFGDYLIASNYSNSISISLKPCLPQPSQVPVHSTRLTLSAAPNPFNPSTKLSFTLASPQTASMDIFDVRGRLIRHLVKAATLGPGVHTYEWNGVDESGVGAASGIYFAKLTTGEEVTVKKVALLK